MGAGALLVGGQTMARLAPSAPMTRAATPAEPVMAPPPTTQTQVVLHTQQGDVTVRSALVQTAVTFAHRGRLHACAADLVALPSRHRPSIQAALS